MWRSEGVWIINTHAQGEIDISIYLSILNNYCFTWTSTPQRSKGSLESLSSTANVQLPPGPFLHGEGERERDRGRTSKYSSISYHSLEHFSYCTDSSSDVQLSSRRQSLCPNKITQIHLLPSLLPSPSRHITHLMLSLREDTPNILPGERFGDAVESTSLVSRSISTTSRQLLLLLATHQQAPSLQICTCSGGRELPTGRDVAPLLDHYHFTEPHVVATSTYDHLHINTCTVLMLVPLDIILLSF